MTNGPADAERERLHGYLMAQGEKYRWLELWPRVVGARVALLDALSSVNEEQAGFRAAEDEWNIRDAYVMDESGAKVIQDGLNLAMKQLPPNYLRLVSPSMGMCGVVGFEMVPLAALSLTFLLVPAVRFRRRKP